MLCSAFRDVVLAEEVWERTPKTRWLPVFASNFRVRSRKWTLAPCGAKCWCLHCFLAMFTANNPRLPQLQLNTFLVVESPLQFSPLTYNRWCYNLRKKNVVQPLISWRILWIPWRQWNFLCRKQWILLEIPRRTFSIMPQCFRTVRNFIIFTSQSRVMGNAETVKMF